MLFQVRPAIPIRLRIRDHDGKPSAARLVFRDASGRVYPPQANRLAPDFFFQQQISILRLQTSLADSGSALLAFNTDERLLTSPVTVVVGIESFVGTMYNLRTAPAPVRRRTT